jgi:tRNA A-37 threonylcarbamoyl transferase component Bud32
MRSKADLIYRLLNKDYAENFSAYCPRAGDFHDVVHSQLPHGWKIERGDIWFYCSPPRAFVPLQGWKIHVSATSQNCRDVLQKVAAVLSGHHVVSFKFALDRSVLSLLNSKSWPRAGAGKFITIYPADSRHFAELIEEIHQATAGMQGPYILSDQRYKDSHVVFYRYGGMRRHTVLDVSGEKIPVLQSPDGDAIPDQRLAYPTIPSWEKPLLPVDSSANENNCNLALLQGRFAIETAVSFSNAGGVYIAHDHHSGKKVVVKEARPFINATSDGYDAIELLKKEYRLLTAMADTGVAPRPVALFQEWEHWFLVEEFIEGMALSRHSAASNVLLRTRASREECDEWCAMFGRLCADLLRILKVLHDRNIVFADLSPNNLIITGAQELKIIDFEGAHQPEVDRAVNIYTPGFVSPYRLAGGQARAEDDYYSAGAVLFSYLLPVNGLLHLNPRARHEILAAIHKDIQLPMVIVDLINDLMDQPGAAAVAKGGVEVSNPGSNVASVEPAIDYQTVVDDVVKHLRGISDHRRNDRLYPADPQVFATNPLSLAYGAAGVAYALYKTTGNIPQADIDWILQHRVTPAEYAPGLYVGMSGIAWSLLEMGLTQRAEEIFKLTLEHPLAYKTADLFHGMAGWGMTALRFFQQTGKEVYLDQARRAGDTLIASGARTDKGYCWSSADRCPLGLAHGSSGVALFLLYLYLATNEERYLAIGLQALDFDLTAAVRTVDQGLSWGKAADSVSPLFSYWRFGSAGVGVAAARYQFLVGSDRYHSVLEQIFIDTDRKYAVFPGRFTGLAGVGDFLLDMFDLSGEQRFLKSANRVAEGMMHFRVEREGAAFPGELPSRLSCDYGTGSSGIALFLNRLMGNQGNDFMLDGLFQKPAWGSARNKVVSNAMTEWVAV